MTGWLLHVLGVDNLSGRWYGFWSGFGSDVGEAGIVAALAAQVRRHNCHVRGCWRVGRHQVGTTSWIVCGRHHPAGAPRRDQVLASAGKEDL